MLRFLFGVVVVAGLLASLGFADTERPILVNCGETLPKNAHYSISMHSNWDTREEPTAGEVSITLVNELTGEKPEVIPDTLQPFVSCVKSSVGL